MAIKIIAVVNIVIAKKNSIFSNDGNFKIHQHSFKSYIDIAHQTGSTVIVQLILPSGSVI